MARAKAEPPLDGPGKKTRPPANRKWPAQSVYLDLYSIARPLGGSGSKALGDACWCWARHLERSTASVANLFSQEEWGLLVLATREREQSFDPALDEPGALLAQWVERAYEDLPASSPLSRLDGTIGRLSRLSWSEAWAVIWALRYRVARKIDPATPRWWTLTYRANHVAKKER